jgi:hypothetical protein
MDEGIYVSRVDFLLGNQQPGTTDPLTGLEKHAEEAKECLVCNNELPYIT